MSEVVSNLEVPAKVCNRLATILQYRRAHGSKGEAKFGDWLRRELSTIGAKFRVSVEGTVIADVGEGSKTLFACHVDTVDRGDDKGTMQSLAYDPNFGHITLDATKPGGTCLGADDGVGVWICLSMIEAKIPGTYVFHRGEEVGAVSARRLLADFRPWLAGYGRAVEFDRPGGSEVIITQGGTNCASEVFGTTLAKGLSAAVEGLDYAVSHKGIFTDVKVYAGVIPECVNIGVGYYDQHGPKEYLDYGHAERLRQACLKLDWEALPTVRVPVAEPQVARQLAPPFSQRAWPPAPAPFSRGPSGPSRAAQDDDAAGDFGYTVRDILEMGTAELEALADDGFAVEAVLLLTSELAAERAKSRHLSKLLGI